MIKFQLSKKFQNASGLEESADSDVQVDLFYSWHVHSFSMERRAGAIFMNDLSRYSVILLELGKADYQNLLTLFVEQPEKKFKGRWIECRGNRKLH